MKIPLQRNKLIIKGDKFNYLRKLKIEVYANIIIKILKAK